MNPSLQDFSTINTHVERLKKDFNFEDSSNSFYFLALDLLFGLQDDEIRDAITDQHFLNTIGETSGKDRGIDAVLFDESTDTTEIHLFNFKYSGSFEKTKSNFPSGEIDKIIGFVNDLLSQEESIRDTLNPILYSKVEEIWKIFESQNPIFHVHLCSNLYEGLEGQEKSRFEKSISRHSNFHVHYHLITDFIELLTRKGKQIIDAKIRAIDKKFFEKSDGDIRALVTNVDIRDVLRIVINNEELRNKPDIEDYELLKQHEIQEDSFEDNVRVYLKQRSKINRNIKKTALSDESHRFFYYNNGITLTCDSFSYPKTQRSPIIELKNLQVVNGSQTIHALHEAFVENSDKFDDLDILCRIYQTENTKLTVKIAEYTNSQNPVQSRDIRSIDYIQQKLEHEFSAIDLFYERKKNQYYDRPKSKRLDAEKTGQVLMAMYNKQPSEAKNQKRIIFAERYEDIFNDSITADKVLLAYRLFEKIEVEKNATKEKLIKGVDDFEKSSYVSYASYWVLFFLAEFANKKGVSLTYSNLGQVWNLYPNVLLLIESLIEKEREFLKKKDEKYSHSLFFKYGKPKKHYEDLTEEDISQFLIE
ncbi:AIPR family protein [Fulvivirga ligni]|uniref:AIPR family protein n=1 Tax=Fulvivirga ligni TaxID=2904246 RepID=UPI001F3913E3|nr:AIPR family protein [Fulvivirga ligni]UII21186.1 AIPR family protein [Fulvivirga ligni]